jgi:hypothetical protein
MSGLSFRFLYADRKDLVLQEKKDTPWVCYLATVYPPGKREHEACEAKEKHIYGDVKIRRNSGLKVTVTPTTKIMFLLCPIQI